MEYFGRTYTNVWFSATTSFRVTTPPSRGCQATGEMTPAGQYGCHSTRRVLGFCELSEDRAPA